MGEGLFPYLTGCAVLLLILTVCRCSGDRAISEASKVPEGPSATWVEKGFQPNLEHLRSVELESDGEGFISKLHDVNLIYQDGMFYAADALPGSGLAVFDSLGHFQRVLPTGRQTRILGLYGMPDQTILAEDEATNALLVIDPLKASSRILARSDRGRGNTIITVGGLDTAQHEGRLTIYTSVFDDYPGGPEYIEKSSLVGAFSTEGELLFTLGKHGEEYGRNNLMSYWMSTFVTLGDRLYLVERALPFVKVYTLSGDMVSEFGSMGRYFHPVAEQISTSATHEELTDIFMKYSATTDISVIRSVRGWDSPVLAVTYQNLLPGHYEHEQSGNYTSNYISFYSLNGDLLHGDLKLAGGLLDVTDEGVLVVNVDDTPTQRVVGLFRLTVSRYPRDQSEELTRQ